MKGRDTAQGLGPWALGALIIAGMIGTGVFTTSGFSVASLGSREAVFLAWAVGGLHAFLGAISYVWLVERHPRSGGEYVLLSRTLHPGIGYIAGWISLLAGFSAPVAAAAHGLEAYTGFAGVRWLGATIILACAVLHGEFAKLGVWFQTLTVIVKVILLGCFIGLGLWLIPIRPDLSSLSQARWSNFGSACVWITFSYTGWNAAIYVAGEIRDVSRDLMKTTILAVALVVVLYLLLNMVFLYAAPIGDLAGKADVGRYAAERLGGSTIAFFLSSLVALALFTSISSMSMIGPRVIWQMARDGFLPSFLGRGEPPPTAAVFFQASLALLIFLFSSLESLLSMIGLTLILSSGATVFGLFVESRRSGWRPAHPLYPIVPLLYLLSTVAMALWMAWNKPYEALLSIAVLACVGATYLLQQKKK